jgi:hypothetical protein
VIKQPLTIAVASISPLSAPVVAWIWKSVYLERLAPARQDVRARTLA